ncbi:MAG: lysophospholipid acyltransferase family protein [Verrucomicrobiota bacterium]|nr:lysophospholipid acyltransferase family protein [Verrucomicrobiota bacterium]
MIKVFAAYSRRYVRRHFHAFRILKSGLPPQDLASPLVIYLNHASWWDPLVCLLLSREFFPSRTSFAPIDAAMLERYGFFKYLGFFGIEQQTPRGAFRFLRTTHGVLASSRNAFWLTPQGRFMDVRERPLRLQDGLRALAAREPHAAFVPLAIEYAFWTEPRPEILVSFGEPIVPGIDPARGVVPWTRVFTDALESTQDELAARSCRRDTAEWLTLNRGMSGVNGIYDAWRWLRARLRGEKLAPEHPAKVTR